MNPVPSYEPDPSAATPTRPEGWRSGNALDSITGRCLVHISARTPAILTEDLMVFLSTFRKTVGLYLEIVSNLLYIHIPAIKSYIVLLLTLSLKTHTYTSIHKDM
jgi:hypothetical protein